MPSTSPSNAYAPPRFDGAVASSALEPFPRATKIACALAGAFGLLSGCGQWIEAQPLATRFGATNLVPWVVALASTRERGWEWALCAAAIGGVFAIDRAARGAADPKIDTRRAYLLALALPVGYLAFCGAALAGVFVVSTIGNGLSARDVFTGFALGAQFGDWALGFGMSAVNAILLVPIVSKAAPALANKRRGLRVKLLAALGVVLAVILVEWVVVVLLSSRSSQLRTVTMRV